MRHRLKNPVQLIQKIGVAVKVVLKLVSVKLKVVSRYALLAERGVIQDLFKVLKPAQPDLNTPL